VPRTKATPAPAVKKQRNAKLGPTQEEITLRAYHIFLERGSTPGDAFEDWIRAERELIAEAGKPRRKSKIDFIAA
jgi:hypothetical protein